MGPVPDTEVHLSTNELLLAVKDSLAIEHKDLNWQYVILAIDSTTE
jgi:hypothetical protein